MQKLIMNHYIHSLQSLTKLQKNRRRIYLYLVYIFVAFAWFFQMFGFIWKQNFCEKSRKKCSVSVPQNVNFYTFSSPSSPPTLWKIQTILPNCVSKNASQAGHILKLETFYISFIYCPTFAVCTLANRCMNENESSV